MERVAGLVVLHDRSAVGSGEPHCVADDPVQDLVEVEARADRLANLPERFQLRDLACQLGPSGLECTHQVDLSQHDRTLGGELLQELAFTVIEGRDVGPPQGEHADDLVLEDHRRGEKGAETGKPLEVMASVVRVLEHVGNLMGTHVHGRAPDGGRTVPGNRMVLQVFAILLRRLAGRPARCRNTSPSRRNSWAACAPHRRAAYSTTVSSTSPGLATERPSAARISRLAADWWRASRNSWCCRNEALVVRVVRDECSLGSAIVTPSPEVISVCAFSMSGAVERRIYLVAI